MKLERLSLANFRGFEQLDIDFEADVTLIAGVNGVGKSAILKALAELLSYSLPDFTPSREAPLTLADTDIQYEKSGLAVSVVFELDGIKLHADIGRSRIDPAKNEELEQRRDQLRFATRETAKNSKEEQEIQDQIRFIDYILSKEGDRFTVRTIQKEEGEEQNEVFERLRSRANQPVAICYSTSRFLSKLPPILPKTKGIEVATAYAKALSQVEVSLNDFANWFRVLSEGGIQKPELGKALLEQLESVVSTFLPGFSGLDLDSGRPPRFSVQKNKARFYLEQLSDGERGLLALVFDLTRRLAMANPDSDKPITEGIALVMIDEIELHLHPKWQREVLRRLRSVFKNCQFVVTTHSPLVLGEVEARCVRFLECQDGKIVVTIPAESYGMDANRILQEFMGASARNMEIDAALKTLFEFIDEERFDEAHNMIRELKKPLGEDEPELTRASSLIKFLEGSE